MKEILLILVVIFNSVHAGVIPACAKEVNDQEKGPMCLQCQWTYYLQQGRCRPCPRGKSGYKGECLDYEQVDRLILQQPQTDLDQITDQFFMNQNQQFSNQFFIAGSKLQSQEQVAQVPQQNITNERCIKYSQQEKQVCLQCQPGYNLTEDNNCRVNNTKIFCVIYSKNQQKCIMCEQGLQTNQDNICEHPKKDADQISIISNVQKQHKQEDKQLLNNIEQTQKTTQQQINQTQINSGANQQIQEIETQDQTNQLQNTQQQKQLIIDNSSFQNLNFNFGTFTTPLISEHDQNIQQSQTQFNSQTKRIQQVNVKNSILIQSQKNMIQIQNTSGQSNQTSINNQTTQMQNILPNRDNITNQTIQMQNILPNRDNITNQTIQMQNILPNRDNITNQTIQMQNILPNRDNITNQTIQMQNILPNRDNNDENNKQQNRVYQTQTQNNGVSFDFQFNGFQNQNQFTVISTKIQPSLIQKQNQQKKEQINNMTVNQPNNQTESPRRTIASLGMFNSQSKPVNNSKQVQLQQQQQQQEKQEKQPAEVQGQSLIQQNVIDTFTNNEVNFDFGTFDIIQDSFQPIQSQNVPQQQPIKQNKIEQQIKEQNEQNAIFHLYPEFPYCIDFFDGMCFACDSAYVLNLIINKCVKLKQDPTEVKSKIIQANNNCNLKQQNSPRCLQCLRNYYYDQESQRCKEADPLCRTYQHDGGQCLSCYLQHKLIDGQCILID